MPAKKASIGGRPRRSLVEIVLPRQHQEFILADVCKTDATEIPPMLLALLLPILPAEPCTKEEFFTEVQKLWKSKETSTGAATLNDNTRIFLGFF